MLYKETVAADTLDLIRRLIKDERLLQFDLVGGTALALRIGHRKSVDIDLFTSREFDSANIADHLTKQFGADISLIKKNMVMCVVSGVKIDMIAHQYPCLKPVIFEEGIRMVSLEDIAAMKINAIANSGTRIKDFYDIFFLLKQFRLEDIFHAYTSKYPNVSLDMAKLSLSYHMDIDPLAKLDFMENPVPWRQVSKFLKDAVNQYDKQIKYKEFTDQLRQKTAQGNLAPDVNEQKPTNKGPHRELDR